MSLRVKYTVFISAFFAAAIVLFSVLAIKEAVNICVKTFVSDGTPLVKNGAKYLNENIENFRNVVEDQNPDSLRYNMMRESLLSMKGT